jgi:hypothetical protein
MLAPPFQELLWDFVYEGAGREGSVQLRVFSTEQELFKMRRDVSMATPVSLPMRRSDKQMSRAEWGRQRPPDWQLMDLGRQLWEAIPDWAKEALLRATADRPCRLKISSNSPVVNDLPWEWLNDGEGPPLALRPEVRLVRSVPVRLPIPPLTVQPPVRVLLVVTDPADEAHPDVWEEIHAVSQRLGGPPYQLDVLQEPTMEALAEALQRGPHILHYIGHAGLDRGEGNLILHDRDNVSYWVGAPGLSKALPLTVRLLCLSTCFTVPNYQIQGLLRLAQTPATYRLPTAIANRYAVSDEGVRRFWEVFYSELPECAFRVSDAFHRAQRAVAELSGTEADWGSFSLVIRDQLGQGLRLEEGAGSVDRYAQEIQAQISAYMANDLAQSLESYGEAVPASLQERLEDEAAKASSLSEDLY